MKKLLLLTFTLISILSQAQQPFIMTWEVNAGNYGILIPTNDIYNYNYSVDFGDGTVLTNQTGDVTHTYSTSGMYTVSISGVFPHFFGPDLQPNNMWYRLRAVEQWGDIEWQDMSEAFIHCETLVINATDAPDLSQVSDMSAMFKETKNFNQSINHWDVSNITNMFELFSESNYNQSLNNWDVSSAIDMNKLFFKSQFNLTINSWDVSNVINMSGMFEESIFNQPIGSWNVSSVVDMSYMFSKSAFNQNINNWNVSSVNNMSEMFSKSNFNQPINGWDVSNVINMTSMFWEASSFDQPLDSWDVSSVIDIYSMFWEATSFNQNINTWDVSNITDFIFMFKDAENFNQPLDSWNMANAELIGSMFDGAASFNQPLNSWDVSSVVNMAGTFSNATSFDQPLNNWNTSNVTSMVAIFAGATSFNKPLDNWNMSSVTNLSGMFRGAMNFNQNINSWDVSSVFGMGNVFNGATSFDQPLDNWDVSNVTSMSGMFKGATIFNQNIDNWNTSNVSYMNNMFENAISFNQPLNNWNTSNVFNMSNMFRNAVQFNQPLDNWDVSDLNCSFSTGGGCADIFYGALSFNQDISNWTFSTYTTSGFEVLNLDGILSNSGMDTSNYDLFLNKLSQISLDSGYLAANNIEYCDISIWQQLDNNGWFIDDGGVGLECELNYVSGYVLYDNDGNGCDQGDIALENYLVNISDGTNDMSVDIDSNGYYIAGLDSGSYTIEILNLNSNFSTTPLNHTVNFTGQDEILDNLDFCISSQNFEDLVVHIFALEGAVPGFETVYKIKAKNNGSQIVPNVQVTFGFDENFQNFVLATVAPTGNTTNMLTFDLVDVYPFSSETIEITMINAIPPILNGGDVLTLTTHVTPVANDITPDNNTKIYSQTVVNSFDPNDKMVFQGNEIEIDDTDQYLDYRIRFQNLGTANAINVKITDTISNKLDWTTFQPITSSHDYRIEIIDGEQINYYFDDINLPFEAADPEGSNGYITYKIKPKPTVQIGDVIENTAYIYFDFNLPIVTNTATTTVIDNLSTTRFETNQIRIYPNPVEDFLNLELSAALNVKSVRLFGLNGKLIKTFENQRTLDLSQIGSGIYILSVETDKGSFYEKVIKR